MDLECRGSMGSLAVAESRLLGSFCLSSLENGIPPSRPAFRGSQRNYLMWRNAVLRWKRTTDHPVEKLGHKVMKSLVWTVQAFVDERLSTEALLQPQRCGVDFEGLGRQGPAGSRKTDPSFSCEGHSSAGRGRDESLRQYTNKEVGADRGSLCGSSRRRANGHLGHNLEGRRAAVKAVRTEPQYTLDGSTELDVVARALNMLDVDAQEGITKAAVKLVVHSFMETGGINIAMRRMRNTEELSGEDESCHPLDEMMTGQLDRTDWRGRSE